MKKSIYFSKKFCKLRFYLESKEIQLIKSILRVNPSNRPEVSQILCQPFFEDEEILDLSKNQRVSTEASEESSPNTPSPSTFEEKYQSFLEAMKANNSQFQNQSKTTIFDQRKLQSSLKPTTPTLQ